MGRSFQPHAACSKFNTGMCMLSSAAYNSPPIVKWVVQEPASCKANIAEHQSMTSWTRICVHLVFQSCFSLMRRLALRGPVQLHLRSHLTPNVRLHRGALPSKRRSLDKQTMPKRVCVSPDGPVVETAEMRLGRKPAKSDGVVELKRDEVCQSAGFKTRKSAKRARFAI